MRHRPARLQGSRRAAPPAARRLLVLALAALVVAGLATPAGAAQTEAFGLEPFPLFDDGRARRVFELELSAGETWTDRVRVWNRTDEVVELRLYGAGATHDGSYQVAPYESRLHGEGAWIAADPGTVRLGPGEERVVSVTVRAPVRLPEGDHLGAIVAEGATGASAGRVDVVTRLAILLVMEPGGRGLFGLHPLVLVALALFALLGGVHAARSLRGRRNARRHLVAVR